MNIVGQHDWLRMKYATISAPEAIISILCLRWDAADHSSSGLLDMLGEWQVVAGPPIATMVES